MGAIKGKDARRYAESTGSTPRTKKFNELILKNIKFNKGIAVLDIGCGSGNTLEILKNKAKSIIGVDASKEMIDICKEKFSKNKNIKLVCSDFTDIKINEKFDVIVLRMTLHHIKNVEAVLKEAKSLLKSKGRIIVIDKYIQKNMRFFSMVNDIYKFLRFGYKDIINHHYKTEEYMNNLFQKYLRVTKKQIIERSKKHTTYLCVLEKRNR